MALGSCSGSSGLTKHTPGCHLSTSPLSALQPGETPFIDWPEQSPKKAQYFTYIHIYLSIYIFYRKEMQHTENKVVKNKHFHY